MPKSKSNKNYSMHDLKNDMHYLKKKVSKLDITINGPDESPEPIGLKHKVGRNSQFIKNMTKAFWIIFSGEITIIITIIVYLLTKAL